MTGTSRLLPRDVLRVGSIGLRTRRLRAVLSALGITLGIAAMVAVVGVSASSRAGLLAELDKLGTNLLTVAPGRTLLNEEASLPVESVGMVGRVGPVQAVSATGSVDARVRRTDLIPEAETGGIAVRAARSDLLPVLGGSVASGTFLNPANERHPVVVLGSVAAQRLGIAEADGRQVWLGERWFTVVGILDPVALAPEIDRAALVGFPAAESLLGFEGSPSTLYVRTNPDAVDDVRNVLPATANPAHPEEVDVSRPSDALAARGEAEGAFTGLLLGLGAVALVVGGVGIANVMVISVLERRSEIGLRRALGASRGHIRLQFLVESLLLSGMGGVGGAVLGTAVVVAYAAGRSSPFTVPVAALAGAVGVALVVGAVAGLYPAMRAARQSPTEALRST